MSGLLFTSLIVCVSVSVQCIMCDVNYLCFFSLDSKTE